MTTATAALVGAVVGDALGAATQGLTPAAVRAAFGRVTGILGGGPFSWEPGAPTPVGTAVLEGAGWPPFPPSRDTRTPVALARELGEAVAGSDGVSVVAGLVAAVRSPGPLDDALEAIAQDGRLRKSMREHVVAGFSASLADDAGALTAAVWAVLQPAPWSDVVLALVDRGGEAPLAAALAGGLLALRDGRPAVPSEWQAATRLVTVIDAALPGGSRPRSV